MTIETEITDAVARLSSYPNVYALGHPNIAELFDGPVTVEEKIDGSQFSMARIGGELYCRSKGQQLVVTAPEGMFEKAVATAAELPLRDGWVYRCEYLQKPKHNTLVYGRVPKSHLIVFDVMTGLETYLGVSERAMECERIGLECVPTFDHGTGFTLESLKALLDAESVLGGCKIEGVVIKNHGKFGRDKKVLIGKYVSEGFKESHRREWKVSNPTAQDIVQMIVADLRTDARWNKSIQHLRDAGQLTTSPQDIGPLLKEIQADTEKEETDYVKDRLFRHFWPQIKRSIVHGFPEFYKEQLAQKAFTP